MRNPQKPEDGELGLKIPGKSRENPGIRDFLKSRDLNPRGSGFLLISGFSQNSQNLCKIPGFRIFHLRDRDIFRGIGYPDKMPLLSFNPHAVAI